MSGYGEPEWATQSNNDTNNVTEEAETGGAVTAPTNTSTTGSTKLPRTGGRGNWMLVALSFSDVGLAAMMAALGVLTLIEVHENGGTSDLSEPFLASYMIMFAVLLFIYELMWWMPQPHLNKTLRRNFGFLYGLKGKGLYLIFVAFLCLGLGRDARVKELNWATGIAYLVVGLCHFVVVCSYPEAAALYIAPTAGLVSDQPENVV